MPKLINNDTKFHMYDPLGCNKTPKSERVITEDQIIAVLHLPQHQAASQLGVTPYILRQAFNKVKSSLGMERWKCIKTTKEASNDSNKIVVDDTYDSVQVKLEPVDDNVSDPITTCTFKISNQLANI